jgi:Carboxypeptidase regulatory-like domain
LQLLNEVIASDVSSGKLLKKMDQKFDINKLRIASPCSVGWETMTGNDRMRHCDSCKLNVYSTDAMTKCDLEDLIFRTEGRTCLRLHRRADGTVLTKDCPVGLRGYQKRVARFAGATLAAIIGLFGVSFGQKDDKKAIDASKIKVERTVTAAEHSELVGTITDQHGAVISGAVIVLKSKDLETKTTTSNDEGVFRFQQLLPSDGYKMEVSSQYFETAKIINLKINSREKVLLNVELEVGSETVVVGVLAMDEPIIDTTSSTITTTITRRKLETIPHQK